MLPSIIIIGLSHLDIVARCMCSDDLNLLFVSGAFGVVYKGLYTQADKTMDVAIKELKGLLHCKYVNMIVI